MIGSRPFRALIVALTIVGATSPFSAGAQSTACDSACLKGFVDGYFDALAARDPGRLPLAQCSPRSSSTQAAGCARFAR